MPGAADTLGEMAAIVSGKLSAFFLFDVAETFDLRAVDTLAGPTTQSRLTTRPTTPSYIQYLQPPLSIDGPPLDSGGFRVRFQVYDYGVISVALTCDLPGDWDTLVARGIEWQEDQRLGEQAEVLCRGLMTRISSAATLPRQTFFSEDYFVFWITSLEGAPAAESVLASRGTHIAQLLRGEREPLSAQEREDVLRHRLSYLERDLVVPTWNAAFVYDTEQGAQGAIEILEFANSQLLEFRHYDLIIDTELTRIYRSCARPAGSPAFAAAAIHEQRSRCTRSSSTSTS